MSDGMEPRPGQAWRSWVSDGCSDAQAESLMRARARSATRDDVRREMTGATQRHIQHLLRLARATLGVDGAQLRLVHPAAGVADAASGWVVSTAASTIPLLAESPSPLHGTLDAVALEGNRPLMIEDILASEWRIARAPESTALGFLGCPLDIGGGVRGVLWAWSRRRREWTSDDAATLLRFGSVVTEELAGAGPPEKRELALEWRDTVLAALTSVSPLALVGVDHATNEVLLYSQKFLELFGLESLEPRLAACQVDASELDAACCRRLREVEGSPVGRAFPPSRQAIDALLRIDDDRVVRRIAFPVPVPGDERAPPICDGYCFEDVSARVAAERLLTERTALLGAVIDSSPLALVATASDGTVLMWNHAAERILGWTAAEVVGGHSPAIAEEDRPLHAAERAAALAGAPWEGREVELHRRDGSRLDMAAFSSLMPSGDWSVLNPGAAAAVSGAVLTAYVDLTERQALEDRLREAQKLEVVGRLAAGAAHDFNNLLTVILGYADLALNGLVASSAPAEDVREIRRTADRATGLTRQLLAFARRTPEGARFSQPSVVLDGLGSLLHRVLGADFELERILAATGSVAVDPVHLEQVILNLVVNARDSMPDGGMVVIETADVHVDANDPGVAAPWQPPAGLPPGPYVVIAVRDEGDGIPPEVEARIFEPFFTTKDQDRGTGLGLSVTADIVRQARGGISVQSTVGAGTSFEIYLPLVMVPAPRTPVIARRQALGPAAYEGLRVLLVEDDDVLRPLLSRVLREAGIEIVEARHGQEALALVRQSITSQAEPVPFDVVVSNLIMPRLGGRSLADALTALQPALRVILTSGNSERLADSAVGQSWEILHKPFTPAALLSLLATRTGSSRSPP